MNMREAPSQLDFTEDPPATLYEAVSRILRHFGDQGATMEDLCGMFQKNITQWKVVSVSPAVTMLVRVGCAKVESQFGTRRIYHLKTFSEFEAQQARIVHRAQRDSRTAKLMDEYAERRLKEQAPAAPVLGKDASLVVNSSKMMLAYGANGTLVCTPKEARELYEILKGIFG